ncbi:lysoplasmalogenase [Bacillus salipaludis]|uniref:Lysoplasmalogenase n=1 Tax=Bacillus salipaludis TaxID=2547811 RepID=A0AA90TSL3_9BACI|nr:lysoplasmalogenase [Bacillus salipaludis]MDQ6597840.1 lysoplasmalogenase [Bacillus salipaludis]
MNILKTYRLPTFILLMSLIYIFAISSKPEAIKMIFKLIPMWLILFYAYKLIPDKKSRPHWIIWCGLFFCMLGDGLIRWFVIGLAAFLIGHLFYTAGFSRYWRFTKLSLLMIIPIGLYGFVMGYHIIAALLQNHNDTLIVPVLMYIVIISLMCWSGFLSQNIWAIIGSILFVLSDSILSWNLFVSEIPYSDILIMTTYYTAQFLIAHSLRLFPSFGKYSSGEK